MPTSTSVCLVAILKDENRFLDEWLAYHRMMGIDHFFLYDDDPTQPLKDFILPHADYSTVIDWWLSAEKNKIRQGNQIKAYNHAVNNYISPFEWVVFLDADEFIVLRKHTTIHEFLTEFKDEVSVSLNWHVFGHNGFFNDPNRLITSSLTRRKFMPYPDVKTITKTAAISRIMHSHYSQLKYGSRVDVNRQKYTDEVYEGKTEIAHINHYLCRSFNNWMKRVDRGDVNFNRGSSPEGQEWRFEKERCLEQFVSILTRDNNEYTDNFMLQYRYDIHEKINKLNRNKYPFIKDFLTAEEQTVIRTKLKFIAELLISKANGLSNIGLFNGKAGIAAFFFHYSRFNNEMKYEGIALDLLDDTSDAITEGSPVSCNDGLAGYGIVVEHLVAESFIKIDTDDFLEGIDVLINHYFIKARLSDPDAYKNAMDSGKYYLSRFNNPVNYPYHLREPGNRRVAEDIIPLISSSSDISHKLDLLNFLCEFYVHRENRSKAMEQIRQLVLDIKSAMDNSNSQSAEIFDPLYAAEILLKFSRKAEDEFYNELANEILQDHEENFWQYLGKNKLPHSYKHSSGLRYLHLAKILNNKTFVERGLDCLRNTIVNTYPVIAINDSDDLKNLLGNGLILLTIVSEWSERLLDLSLLFTAEFDKN